MRIMSDHSTTVFAILYTSAHSMLISVYCLVYDVHVVRLSDKSIHTEIHSMTIAILEVIIFQSKSHELLTN